MGPRHCRANRACSEFLTHRQNKSGCFKQISLGGICHIAINSKYTKNPTMIVVTHPPLKNISYPFCCLDFLLLQPTVSYVKTIMQLLNSFFSWVTAQVLVDGCCSEVVAMCISLSWAACRAPKSSFLPQAGAESCPSVWRLAKKPRLTTEGSQTCGSRPLWGSNNPFTGVTENH